MKILPVVFGMLLKLVFLILAKWTLEINLKHTYQALNISHSGHKLCLQISLTGITIFSLFNKIILIQLQNQVRIDKSNDTCGCLCITVCHQLSLCKHVGIKSDLGSKSF